jgi:acyl-coenzyme A thioesterase PaaI-like protein
MTTSQQMDAIELAKYRRRALPDTPETRAYVGMLAEVAAFQEALVQANPTAEQVEQLTASLAEMRKMLEAQAVPEHERWYGRGEAGGTETQVLMPAMTFEHVDDHELRASTTPGEYFMGMNQAMHGGVISVLFDTAMGRLAMGTKMRICRTAYLTTHYRKVVPMNQRLDLRAKVDSQEGRKLFLTAELWHEDTLCAEADALFVKVRPGAQ